MCQSSVNSLVQTWNRTAREGTTVSNSLGPSVNQTIDWRLIHSMQMLFVRLYWVEWYQVWSAIRKFWNLSQIAFECDILKMRILYQTWYRWTQRNLLNNICIGCISPHAMVSSKIRSEMLENSSNIHNNWPITFNKYFLETRTWIPRKHAK